MNWLRQFKTMNAKQKRDLKNKLSIIYNNIVFQIGVATLFLYGALWLWAWIEGA